MSINHFDHTSLHPAWCAPDAHAYITELDTRHRTHVHVHECLDSGEFDPSTVEVSVEQYADRRDDGEWTAHPATVLLDCTRDGGADLSPLGARLLARRLLAAADIADGSAVDW